ncbi:hypothetical protein ASPWEDRAFT_711356 [Aspergillus wentii DTO 134E9]|uniref:C2H2-type domain-containing protein n=1 Tax=Aspergillus wentii DTO 134E9 TaxID=1073089 RepID=A0A1L9R694_ASPWE|nr:uncharacterized protein ASPWEDRAFT_711356 [Aspergillus wentii DTO 134E9]KAI9926895.1 hypothetical protein MW887_003994 [Aspergillus wentii]OJJ30434.1 hypothetical protein ASPWEDRAFT_711356 [Aspergillus wentii DTO 134E9]
MPRNTRSRKERTCSWCSQSFTKDEHLARHIRTHTREKPFVCDECERAFSRHDSLLRHTRSHQLRSSQPVRIQAASVSEDTVAGSEQSGQIMRNSVPPSLHGLDGDIAEPLQQPASHVGENISCAGNRSEALPLFARLPGNAVDLDSAGIVAQDAGLFNTAGPGTGVDSYMGDIGVGSSNDGTIWDFDAASLPPAWLASEDFDLNALNSSIMASTTNWFLQPDSQNNVEATNYVIQPSTSIDSTRREDIIRQQWFTFIGDIENGYDTPDVVPEKTQVDEAYRESLADKLYQQVPALPLPSTDFLNLCIQMYFTRFDPIFPIVHAPTFRPSAQSSLLLISICSVGSLFVGSSYATSQGIKIFETLHKAILASWERYISGGEAEAMAMIQAALIGQTFGLLSERPKDLLTVHTFHGTFVAWSRCHAPKRKQVTDNIVYDELAENPEKAWKTWIRAEEWNRLVAGIHIHDVEVSELFLTEPFIRHTPSKKPNIAEDSLWTAPTAGEWCKIMKNRSSTSAPSERRQTYNQASLFSSGLSRYIELEEIAASIAEDRSTDSLDMSKKYESLVQFYNSHLKSKESRAADPYCLQVLWHFIFISLYVDFNHLELALGKEGFDEAQRHVDYAREWACSRNGRRCALHGALILRNLEMMRLGTEPAIHVPRIVFRTAIVWFCYTKFASADSDTSHQAVDFPELTKMGINTQRLLFEANGLKPTRPQTPESSTLCGLVDILQRVGHWDISRKFASILTLLMEDKTGL